jgi:spectinomycin phosphotransferase
VARHTYAARVRAFPSGVDTEHVVQVLADGWGLVVESAEYAPVGAGSYHWSVSDETGGRWFVTVDDLASKLWLGDDPEVACAGLRRAFDTAAAVRDSGLGCVVAPLRTNGGDSLVRLGPWHTVALFPHMTGEPGHFGEYSERQRAQTLRMVTALHLLGPSPAPGALRAGFALLERTHLDAALRDLSKPWTGGPASEAARRTFSAHAVALGRVLDRADRTAASLSDRNIPTVITHGEPHAANVLFAEPQSWLIDWDTVALGPPERDLWMVLQGSDGDADAYVLATGHRPDPDAMDYFGLLWDLKGIAAFLQTLRAPHQDDEDTQYALEGLRYCLGLRCSDEQLE